MIIRDQEVKCKSIDIIQDIYESYGQSGTVDLGPPAATACCGQAARRHGYQMVLSGRGKSQPDSLAIRMSSTRLRPPVFVIARDR